MIDLRHDDQVEFRDGTPLTWHVDPHGLVIIRCGRGHLGTLAVGHADGHVVATDGTVTPSCVCPRPGCGWHEMIRLLDWTPLEGP